MVKREDLFRGLCAERLELPLLEHPNKGTSPAQLYLGFDVLGPTARIRPCLRSAQDRGENKNHQRNKPCGAHHTEGLTEQTKCQKSALKTPVNSAKHCLILRQLPERGRL